MRSLLIGITTLICNECNSIHEVKIFKWKNNEYYTICDNTNNKTPMTEDEIKECLQKK